jgi:carbohydrate diacid regulator
MATLRAFIRADGNVAEAAKPCFVHKNTLRYRLQRLTEILGRDPGQPDAKFQLRMAFDLVDLFAGIGVDLLPRPERV